jgi:hypothetical protein
MKFHGVDMQGEIMNQRVSSLPAWTAADEGRLLFVTSEQAFYYGTATEWIPMYIFKNFAVSGQTTVVADDAEDTLTLVQGNNFLITTSGDTITLGLNAAANSLLSDTTNFLASGRKLWIYENVAPTGWTIVAGTSDALLAVKGGTNAYSTTGGVQAGTWTLSGHIHGLSTDAGHTHSTQNHTLTVAEMPSHSHQIFIQGGGGTTHYPLDVDSDVHGGYTYTNPYIGGYVVYPEGGNGTHNHSDTFSGGSHTHSLAANADTSTWRMLANVGIIIEKD